jgi:hypothetical protein
MGKTVLSSSSTAVCILTAAEPCFHKPLHSNGHLRNTSLTFRCLVIILSHAGVAIKTGFGLDSLTPYTFTTQDYWQYSAITILHSFQFTAAHALGFSVFTSCIQTMDLWQYHCYFKSHVKSSGHSLIPFLPLFCSCQFQRLNSAILDYCSLLFKRPSLSLHKPSVQTPLKTQPVLLRRHVYCSIT